MDLKSALSTKYGTLLFWVDFILPLPLTVLALLLWYHRTGWWTYSLFVVVLPLLFGYVVPGIGTNLFKLWRFNWDFFRIGRYFLHHGFLFAPYFALSLFLTFPQAPPFDADTWVAVLVSNAALQCLLSAIHDYLGLRAGMIEIDNRAFREGKGPADIILDYGPIGYSLFGLSYAAVCLAARFYLACGWLPFVGWLLLGLLAMGLSGVPYLYHERVWIWKNTP